MELNLIGKVLLGALVIAVFAAAWYLLTQKNSGKGGCTGNCAGCGEDCERRKKE